MNAKIFIEKLRLLKPVSKAIDQANIKEIQEEFDKIDLIDNNAYDFLIEEIVNNYSVNLVSTGSFRFLESTRVKEEYLFFAELEADYICLNTTNEKIVLIDHEIFDFYAWEFEEDYEVTDNIIMSASVSQNSFLDCLILAFEFGKTKWEDNFINENWLKLTTKKCIELSGGEEYAKFWQYFFGCEVEEYSNN